MQSTMNPDQTDKHNVFAHVNEEIARAYEQIARADEEIARSVAQDAASHPSGPKTRVTAADRPAMGRPAVRGLIGFLLAVCISAAAIGWQSSYGDAAKQIIARRAPQLVMASSSAPEDPALSAQPTPTAATGANEPPAQPAALAQAAPEAVAPAAAVPPAESPQLLQSMARDLASVGQEIEQLTAGIEQLKAGIEQLKTNQEQMARDNARAAEQFKTSQEQMARDMAKVSEQSLRPKRSTPPPMPVAAPAARKPVALVPSSQARAQR
jgi:hypothetical protein